MYYVLILLTDSEMHSRARGRHARTEGPAETVWFRFREEWFRIDCSVRSRERD